MFDSVEMYCCELVIGSVLLVEVSVLLVLIYGCSADDDDDDDDNDSGDE